MQNRYRKGLAALAGAALFLAACSGADEPAAPAPTTPTTPSSDAQPLRIAFFASSSQNGYNQAVYEGVQLAAKELGAVETEIFDGQFSADIQFNQIEDIVASGRFDGFVVVPNDNVGIASALEAANEAGIPTAAALFPIGPDVNDLTPQIPGMITAATLVGPQAEELARGVVEYCEDIDPCRVIIMMGLLQYPFDNVRYQAFLNVLEPEANIQILALGEGNYDRDLSLSVMQDLIQAHPEFDVLLSNADQHVSGAEIALVEAGFDLKQMYIAGGGATSEAIEAIRDGRWSATASGFPRSEGYFATKNLIQKLRGLPFDEVNSLNELGPVPGFVITKETLDQFPDFEAEWTG